MQLLIPEREKHFHDFFFLNGNMSLIKEIQTHLTQAEKKSCCYYLYDIMLYVLMCGHVCMYTKFSLNFYFYCFFMKN